MSKSTIGRIEYGDVTPSEATLKRIALALGTTYADLTRPAGPRLRTKKVAAKELPFAVGKLLIRVGNVTRDELNLLCRCYDDPDFAKDTALLELYLRFRRACAAMHDRSKKKAFDTAFERLRADMRRL